MKKLKILSSFDIKIIAMITMIIDHIGYFFYFKFDDYIYTILRSIGRISMPLFVFLIYQGYKHTKSLKKYILRLLELAIVTQALTLIVGVIFNMIDSSYAITFYMKPNIIFSFAISLLLLELYSKLYDTKSKEEKFIGIITVIGLLSTYILVDIEYGFIIPFIITILFLYDKIVEHKKFFFTISILIFLLLFSENIMIYSLFAIIPIMLYSGKKGYSNNKIFYYFYPFQYLFLMILGFIVYKN